MGCRQGGRCPALGGLSLLAEPGQGKVRWAAREFSSLLIPVPVTAQGAQAVHPSHGPSPGLGAPLPPGDGWQARGRRLPWQPRHPQGNSEACTRVWAPLRISRPQPRAGGRGFRGLKRMGGGGNWVYPAPHCLGVESPLGSRGTRPGRGSYSGSALARGGQV